MKRLLFLSVIGILSIFNSYAQNSHIQVVSEPGIVIFLDGLFKGTTSSEFGGLIIQNITPGQHSIKVVKEGYIPQEEIIDLKVQEVFTFKVNKNFIPSIQISEQGNKDGQSLTIKMGNLKIQSLPININISIPALSININKTQDEWLAKDIPADTYDATFSWNNKTLQSKIVIENESQTYAFINMLENKIENMGITLINPPKVIENKEVQINQVTAPPPKKNVRKLTIWGVVITVVWAALIAVASNQ